MGLFGIIWDYLELYGIIWNYVGLYGIMWDYVGLFGIMWDYLPKVGLWCTLLSQRFPPRRTQRCQFFAFFLKNT
jgi:hypothetical protein